MIKRVYNHSAKVLNFEFLRNEEDLIIIEQSFKFSNDGEFLIIKVEKVNIDTFDMIEELANFLNIYKSEIGYSSIKEKKAKSIQYLSIPKKYSRKISYFTNKKIKIIDSFLHKNKLRFGEFSGNRFKITLHKTTYEELNHIQRRIKKISKEGLLNYFGYEKLGKNAQEIIDKARDFLNGDLKISDAKISRNLINAYQCNIFNSWLVSRTKKNKGTFLLLDGDVFFDYKKGKYIIPEVITPSIHESFGNKTLIPTGLLPGKSVIKSINKAREVEEKFDNSSIKENGLRREALVFPKNVLCSYDENTKKCTVEFTLPKESFCSVFIEFLANKNFS